MNTKSNFIFSSCMFMYIFLLRYKTDDDDDCLLEKQQTLRGKNT